MTKASRGIPCDSYLLIMWSNQMDPKHSILKGLNCVGKPFAVSSCSFLLAHLSHRLKVSCCDHRVTVLFSIVSKEEGKDQESIQSSTTPDPGHCMGK